MIDLKVQTLGGKEIADKLKDMNGAVQSDLRAELASIGEEIVTAARARAPKRTGIMASRILWYFGREVMRSRGRGKGKYRAIVDGPISKHARKEYRDRYAGAILMTVRPTGTKAHLVERGVNATFEQRIGNRTNREVPKSFTLSTGKVINYMANPTFTRSMAIPARPFFTPAVESVGGPTGVNARLQARINSITSELNQVGA